MNTNIKDAIVASFVADALSLGVHWVYDTSKIEAKYGRLESMVTPELAPYHQPKQKGEFTHCGDQMMVLLESVTEVSGFNLHHFSAAWQKMMQSYTGYLDHATKETMLNFNSGKTAATSGSLSSELSGASRIAPLVLNYGEDIDGFIAAAKAQTAMTHNEIVVLECAELFARVSATVLKGTSPTEAFEKALNDMPNALEIQQMVKAGIDSSSKDTREMIAKFGQMCSAQAALPSTIHLIVKHEDSLEEALIENIMAGGDSSARGMLSGFILGCYQGLQTVPKQWLEDMAAHKKITRLLQAFTLG